MTPKRFTKNGLQKRMPFSHQELITPFDSLINELFNDTYSGLSKTFGDDFFVKGAYPKVNVLDLEDKILIEAAIPGMTKSDITVEVKGDTLTVSGQNNQNEDHSDTAYIRRELKRSKFRRSFALGENLDQGAISASCEDGVLTLDIPKLKPESRTEETRVIDIL